MKVKIRTTSTASHKFLNVKKEVMFRKDRKEKWKGRRKELSNEENYCKAKCSLLFCFCPAFKNNKKAGTVYFKEEKY